MSDLCRYIHGSEDSVDLDVIYVFDELPAHQQCAKFCLADKSENRNIITIKDGVVSDCYIGTCDEINNALIETYKLHTQNYPLLITRRVERDVLFKLIRVVRGILSLLSRTLYRKEVKSALHGNLTGRLSCLENIKLSSVDFNDIGKHRCKADVLKILAFQLGQANALVSGVECYSKASISNMFPEMRPFLYRIDTTNVEQLDLHIHKLLMTLKRYKIEELGDSITVFSDSHRKIDIKNEREIFE